MKASAKKIVKMLIVMLATMATIFCLFPIKVNADPATGVLVPEDDQYLELRAVDVNDFSASEQGQQVVMELWAHNLEFKGFHVRFSYDATKIQPSNMNTNVVTLDSDQYFKFEDEFINKLDFFTLNYTGEGQGIEAMLSIEPPETGQIQTGAHIKSRGENDYYIKSGEDLLIGKMSFHMTEEGYEDGWLSLVTNNNSSPSTGIKISVTIPTYYEDQSTFRFTNETASRDANLSNLIVSHGVKDDDPDISTYKEYALVPIFHQDTIRYELELLEYIDDVDITPTLSDETATMTIEIPKRDENNELVYSGDQIVYEEKTMMNNVPLNVVINKLGEPNTILKVKVTAEDGVTEKEYTVTIRRPHGTIKGKLQLGSNLKDTMLNSLGIRMKHNANVTLYDTGVFDWDGVVPGTSSLNDLDSIQEATKCVSDDDGNYEIHVIPGTYDLILERRGFLASVTKNIAILDGQTIDMNPDKVGTEVVPTILYDGDSDRSGIIGLPDLVEVNNLMSTSDGDGLYEDRCDFGQKGYVALADLVSVNNNIYMTISINSR